MKRKQHPRNRNRINPIVDIIALLGENWYVEFNLTRPQSEFWHLPESNPAVIYPLFIGGYNSGKSFTAIWGALTDIFKHPGARVAVYSPTHDLMSLNLLPRFKQTLDDLCVGYTEQKTLKIIDLGYGEIIFRSMDNPSSIISYEVFRSHVDEIDGIPIRKAEEAWTRILARNRQKIGIKSSLNRKTGEYRKFYANRVSSYGTPEGFNFTYERWKKNPTERYAYVRAPTISNPHRTEDYVDNLKDSYTKQQIKAYLEGRWVPLRSGSVYPDFDRKENNTTYLAAPRETLHIGMDFNVMQGAAVVHVIREGLPYAVGEIVESRDTLTTCNTIRELYPDHPIIVYPDASGKSRTTQNFTESDMQRIRDAGFSIDVPNENPPIKDRVAAMNAMFHNANGARRYKVNEEKCPNYVLALEQQSYKNGVPDKTTGIDHVIDAAGYFIHRRYPIERIMSGMQKIKGY